MIKRKYQPGETIPANTYYAESYMGGKPRLLIISEKLVQDISPESRWARYEVGQEAATKALTLPPEPKHGEVWECKSFDGIRSLYYFCHDRFFSHVDESNAFKVVCHPTPIRKIGNWLEEK
jgi:hypothetical protein